MLNVDSVKFHAPVQEHVSLNTQRTNVRQKRYKIKITLDRIPLTAGAL